MTTPGPLTAAIATATAEAAAIAANYDNKDNHVNDHDGDDN